MKNLIFLLVLLLPTHFLFSQNKEETLKVKFGKISPEEIAMKSYPADPNAPAVILFEKGYISWGSFNKFEYHTRIKIFKKEAYDLANFEFFYRPKNKESLDEVKAISFNQENGKLVETEATSSQIFEEKINKNMTIVKVAVPGVREGTIIDIKYSIINPDMRSWTFQNTVPTIWSEYEMLVPEYYVFSPIGQGNTPYFINTKSHRNETLPGNKTMRINEFRWVQKDVPAISKEPDIFSLEDYRTRLTFYLEAIYPPNALAIIVTPTWQKFSKDLWEDEDFGKIINSKSAMKDELAAIITPDMAASDKIQGIYSYLGQNFEVGRTFNNSVKEMKSKKKVNGVELNLLLLNMLKNAGVSASPVLIRKREEGHVSTNLPVLSRFTHLICRVELPKDTFFMDATAFPMPYKLLNFSDLSEYGVLLSEPEGIEFVNPTSALANRTFTQAQLQLEESGEFKGVVNLSYSGYEAYQIRQNTKKTSEKEVISRILGDFGKEGTLESLAFENATNPTDEKPLKGSAKVSSTAYCTKSGDKLYISPLLAFGKAENPYKQDTRQFDVNFGHTDSDIFQLQLTLPAGYAVEELPKSAKISLAENALTYDYLISVKENVLTLNSKFQIKKVGLPRDEYPFLKEFYGQIIEKMGEQIVLTKL